MATSTVRHPKLLVANRSEIACRIFQTCREMGIATVGVVAPGDEEARHVTYADETVQVASYLDPDALVQAASASKAHYVHPGYGFLSERPIFVKKVEEAGMVFIGPRSETMELMGGKIAAKDLAVQEGVPVLPWARVKKGEDLRQAAKTVGFPLLLKASAGGGGKGMRRVDRPEDLAEAAESASAEAIAAFGDGTLFLERYLARPRHIEIQVFGDGRGGGVHLHERDCSLQRRHQKIWEEATAPHLSEAVREGLFEAALKLIRKTQYRNAGTIEFLVDDSDGAGEKFYFLEMNTRLQVEHPVTEAVTGVDLVQSQILQALHPEQSVFNKTPSVRGHAIEVRLYAEDPAQGFIPTPGRVEKLRWPTGAGIRVDSGIEEGQTVGAQYDSMLAKLIVHAPNREHAIRRLRFALEETVILGLGTNQAYLWALTQNPDVLAGKIYTGFLGNEMKGFAPIPQAYELEAWLAAQKAGFNSSQNGNGTGGQGRFSSAENTPASSPWVGFVRKGFPL